MSAIADLYVLPTAHADALGTSLDETLDAHARPWPEEFGWSGYVAAYTLMFLEERGLELDTTLDSAGTVWLFTAADRRHLPLLDPAAYTDAELREAMYYEGDPDDPDALDPADGARHTITYLREALLSLADDETAVLRVC